MKLITILTLLFCLNGNIEANNKLPQQNIITFVYNYNEQPSDSIVDQRKVEGRTLRKQRRLKRTKNRPKRNYVVLDVIGSLFVEILIEILIEDILFGG